MVANDIHHGSYGDLCRDRTLFGNQSQGVLIRDPTLSCVQ